ncbi:hypothetical protein K504DRAFT_265924 [Pleomassaria siparia CBS 279.74]|uniref:Uncharacterized protein n=1 Tax=Pleomassaria siparia CBS 279.74 TaxID=1314801 RepID=A0A6G1KDM1_9PLEO|nr:hypothetical protein K504DRAFT_265924 [Pleomassaria siparia CBS 279.74]
MYLFTHSLTHSLTLDRYTPSHILFFAPLFSSPLIFSLLFFSTLFFDVVVGRIEMRHDTETQKHRKKERRKEKTSLWSHAHTKKERTADDFLLLCCISSD